MAEKGKTSLIPLALLGLVLLILALGFGKMFTNSSAILTEVASGMPAGGSDGEIQYNDNNSLQGTPSMIYDGALNQTFLPKTNMTINEVEHTFDEIIINNQEYPVWSGRTGLGQKLVVVDSGIFMISNPLAATPGAFLYFLNKNLSNFGYFVMHDASGQLELTNFPEFYVNVPTNIKNPLYLGTNTADGLSNGDLNASTIYYDTLTAKSPVFKCSEGSNWCKVEFPEYQQELFLEHNGSWTVTEIVYRDVSYTPQQFNQNFCQASEKKQSACNEMQEKTKKLGCKKEGKIFSEGNCYKDPILECSKQEDFLWNARTGRCEHDPAGACKEKGGTYVGDSCILPFIEQMPEYERCNRQEGMLWVEGSCISLDAYYA